MYIVEQFYKKVLKQEPPYYTKYTLVTIIWKPIRKYINVVIIPNVPFSNLRVALYRMIGFNIGKNVFIGMKCYMDDVAIKNAYIGMRCNIISGKDGVTIGENTIVGAGSLVNKDIPSNATAVGVPVKILDNKKEAQ